MGYKIYAPKPMSDESMEMLRKRALRSLVSGRIPARI